MSESLELASTLDLVAAPRLHDELLRLRGQKLEIDAGQVQRLGGQCLQLLLAARAAWEADEQALSLRNPSDEFMAALELMGVSLSALNYQQEQETMETSR